MRPIAAIAVIFALSLSASAEAAMYKWQDDKGVLHFTDDSDKISARYQSRAREVARTPGEVEKQKMAEKAASQPAQPAAVVQSPAEAAPSDGGAEELQALKQALAQKRTELGKLRHKWVVAKGRNPSRKEIEEFEKKRAKGEAELEDNPYISKNPLSRPGPARVAYYKKLEEIKKDEERIRALESELALR